jgi:hypothetical protein
MNTTVQPVVQVIQTSHMPAGIRLQTYAEQQNAQYNHTGSKLVDLGTRFQTTISGLPRLKQSGARSMIANACKEFEKKNPHITCFEDLLLAVAGWTYMSHILIDITIQRLLNLPWVADILINFREVQADPIKLYEVVGGGNLTDQYPPGTILFASWDAQHTAIVYWIIAVMIFKQDPAKVKVPSILYKIKNRSDIRENFVSGNSDIGKLRLDSIDLYRQMVLGVRLDDSMKPKWIEAELKQQHLEGADLFVTAEKFGDTHMAGAISRMTEIDKYTSDIINKFCLYTTTIPVPRPIDSQEIEIMCAWFNLAKEAGIDYTDDEVISLGSHVHQLFGGDFHESSQFWNQVRTAYENWHKKYYAGLPAQHRPKHVKMSKNWNTGGTFLWHQLNKTWQGRMPGLNASTSFIPARKDLY